MRIDGKLLDQIHTDAVRLSLITDDIPEYLHSGYDGDFEVSVSKQHIWPFKIDLIFPSEQEEIMFRLRYC